MIGLGGAIGAILRSLLSALPGQTSFPYGTLLVNLLGSFLIGVLWVLFETRLLPEPYKPFLITGMLGALTTFSTYSLDNLKLLEGGQIGTAVINIIVSNALGLVCVFVGAYVGRLF